MLPAWRDQIGDRQNRLGRTKKRRAAPLRARERAVSPPVACAGNQRFRRLSGDVCGAGADCFPLARLCGASERRAAGLAAAGGRHWPVRRSLCRSLGPAPNHDRKRRVARRSAFASRSDVPLHRQSSALVELCAICFAIGCVSAFFVPAQGVMIPALVDRTELLAASAAMQQTWQWARIASPGVAAALVARFTENACFVADAASFVISALLVAAISHNIPRTSIPAHPFPAHPFRAHPFPAHPFPAHPFPAHPYGHRANVQQPASCAICAPA